jgi:hypothetical protein
MYICSPNDENRYLRTKDPVACSTLREGGEVSMQLSHAGGALC